MTPIAYLLSEYPTLGHTYILREVRELRDLGWRIQTISIRTPARNGVDASPAQAEERKSTWYILDSGMAEFLRAHAATLATRPLRYLGALGTALRFGRCNFRSKLHSIAYFAEAVVVGNRLRRAGIEHVHSVYTSTVALILSRIFDIRLSLTIHGPTEFFDAEGSRLRQKVAVAEFVTAISYFCKSQIMLWAAKSDWRKIEVVPLGVNPPRGEAAPFREHPSPLELITVGRLTDIKGYPLLLQAVVRLTQQGKDVRLRLVGDGPDRATLAQQARELGIGDKVIFEGWKTQSELRELYRNSDLCVLSSFSEGVPVVLMEAMACGVPCVAPRVTGVPELIRDGVEGLLVAPANVDELVSAIASLAERTELRRSMAAASRQRIAECYNLHTNVARLSELFIQRMQRGPAANLTSG